MPAPTLTLAEPIELVLPINTANCREFKFTIKGAENMALCAACRDVIAKNVQEGHIKALSNMEPGFLKKNQEAATAQKDLTAVDPDLEREQYYELVLANGALSEVSRVVLQILYTNVFPLNCDRQAPLTHEDFNGFEVETIEEFVKHFIKHFLYRSSSTAF